MKIVHVLLSMKVGGIPALITDIANEQVKTNEVTFVVVNDLCVQSMMDGVDKRIKILRVNRKVGSWNPYYMLKLNWYVWNERPDIVHCHAVQEDKWLPFTHGAPKVVTVHNARHKKDYGHFAQIYGISEGVCKVIKETSGLDSVCVYNAIRPENFVPSVFPYIPGEMLRIICVGRVFDYKGQYLLVEAAKIMRDRGVDKFSITIVGGGDDLDHLISVVKEEHLDEYVEFLGQQPREFVFEHLHEYHLFVLPSVTEGFGLTLAEAMSARVPVLSSNLEGPLEVIKNGEYGMVFQSEDVEDLVQKILDFKEGRVSVDLYAAEKFVRDNFSIQSTTSRYIDEYKKVINNK